MKTVKPIGEVIMRRVPRSRRLQWLLVFALSAGLRASQFTNVDVTACFLLKVDPGLNLFANPVETPDNSVAAFFQTAPVAVGTQICSLTGNGFTTNTLDSGPAWTDPAQTLEPGDGVFLLNPEPSGYVFLACGSLLQGQLTNPIPAGLSLKSSLVGLEGGLGSKLGLRLGPFDNVYRWNHGQFMVFTQLPGGGWFPSEPVIAPGEAFFIRASQATNWVQTFKPNALKARLAVPTAPRAETPALTGSQGTINFANGAAGVNAPVTVAGSGQPVEGNGWRAELWQVGNGGAFTQVGQAADFATPVAGYFLGGLTPVPGTLPGDEVTVVVRVINAGATMLGMSSPTTLRLGGDKLPPTNLTGLQPWTVKPLDAAMSIALVGGQVAVSWPNDLMGFVLEEAAELAAVAWTPVAQPPQIVGSRLSVTLAPHSRQTYFRLRSSQ